MSIKCMTKVWDQSGQGGSKRLLLLAIADHADDPVHRVNRTRPGKCEAGTRGKIGLTPEEAELELKSIR